MPEEEEERVEPFEGLRLLLLEVDGRREAWEDEGCEEVAADC
jgi:hypothetical protein